MKNMRFLLFMAAAANAGDQITPGVYGKAGAVTKYTVSTVATNGKIGYSVTWGDNTKTDVVDEASCSSMSSQTDSKAACELLTGETCSSNNNCLVYNYNTVVSGDTYFFNAAADTIAWSDGDVWTLQDAESSPQVAPSSTQALQDKIAKLEGEIKGLKRDDEILFQTQFGENHDIKHDPQGRGMKCYQSGSADFVDQETLANDGQGASFHCGMVLDSNGAETTKEYDRCYSKAFDYCMAEWGSYSCDEINYMKMFGCTTSDDTNLCRGGTECEYFEEVVKMGTGTSMGTQTVNVNYCCCDYDLCNGASSLAVLTIASLVAAFAL